MEDFKQRLNTIKIEGEIVYMNKKDLSYDTFVLDNGVIYLIELDEYLYINDIITIYDGDEVEFLRFYKYTCDHRNDHIYNGFVKFKDNENYYKCSIVNNVFKVRKNVDDYDNDISVNKRKEFYEEYKELDNVIANDVKFNKAYMHIVGVRDISDFEKENVYINYDKKNKTVIIEKAYFSHISEVKGEEIEYKLNGLVLTSEDEVIVYGYLIDHLDNSKKIFIDKFLAQY